MAKECETIFPFGNRLFIGIVKFFDSAKGFGYIASNNYGMDSKKRFSDSEQGFYIDNSSWSLPIQEKKAVVFRPAIKDTKLRAEDVRVVNLETDRDLVMDYYEHNNFICFDEKVKRFSVSRYGNQHFEGYSNVHRKYNILLECGICRYELLNEYAQLYAQMHDYNSLLTKIEKIINVIGGESAYNKQLRAKYGNKEKEHASWKKIIALLDNKQISNLIELHPSLQIFAPDELLLGRIESIDTKWGVSLVVGKAIREIEESKKLKEIEDLIDTNMQGKSRKEMEDVRTLYETKISPARLANLNRCIDESTLLQIRDGMEQMSVENISDFIRKATNLSNEYEHLSNEGKKRFKGELGHIYENKIVELVQTVSTLVWDNYQKKDVKSFILNDRIVLSEEYIVPKQVLKESVLQDYFTLFVQTDDVETPFCRHSDFEEEYSCLLSKQEHENILAQVKKKSLSEGGLFSIVRLFSFLEEKLPDTIKDKFISLPIEDIVSNVSIMGMFEDHGRSILGCIVTKILDKGDCFFHKEQTESRVYGLNKGTQNIKFAKSLVSICGKEYIEQHFLKLKAEDRLDLYIEIQLNIITAEELKRYLLGTPNANYQVVLPTAIGKEAVLSIIMDSDCSTAEGIRNVIIWMERYVGEVPNEFYDKLEWGKKRKMLIDSIATSGNEYLKVLTWALYFQSSGKIVLLKDVFHLYPTSLQIRIIKRFFYAMSVKKFSPSLTKLKETVGGDTHQLSLPVEIVFKYLSLKIENPDSRMTDAVMLSLIQGREDYSDFFMINRMLNPCKGRLYISHDDKGLDDSYRNFSGTIKKCIVEGNEVYRVLLCRKQLSINEKVTQYNNTFLDSVKEYINIAFARDVYKPYQQGEDLIYDFGLAQERELRIMAEAYRLKMDDVEYNRHYELDENAERFCCECRVSNNLDRSANKVFLWCRNRPCFHRAPYFHTSTEWERYTVLDFMRILSIPTHYVSQKGKMTRHGQYIIFSTYMLSFYEFLEHLKCRKCGKLMEPCDISNFARSTITEFACTNQNCELQDKVIYLNRCFNSKCNSIIDSRDSKQCPNNSYICENCGACCSTQKFSERYDRLQITGGHVSQWLIDAIRNQIGHWEKNELYCSSCGNKMESNTCTCGKTYEQRNNFDI